MFLSTCLLITDLNYQSTVPTSTAVRPLKAMLMDERERGRYEQDKSYENVNFGYRKEMES